MSPSRSSRPLTSPSPGPLQLVLEDPDDELATLGYGMGEDIDVETAICHAVDELSAEGDGDILVFLPGERDIRDTEAALLDHLKGRGRRAGDDKGAHPGDIEILSPVRAAERRPSSIACSSRTGCAAWSWRRTSRRRR